MKRKMVSRLLVSVASMTLLFAVPASAAKKVVDVERIYGRIQFVTAFADYDVKLVDRHEDLRVQIVERFPDSCGKWQIVERFPDYKIRIVENHPDFTVRYVERFPGANFSRP